MELNNFQVYSFIIKWNLIITRTIGPGKLPCFIRFLVISGLKQKYKEMGPEKNHLVMMVLVYELLYNLVPLYTVLLT